MIHQLKINPEPLQAIIDGNKKAEFRKNDRGFKAGDTLVLAEWAQGIGYLGPSREVLVTHVQSGYGIPEDYVMLSIELLPEEKGECVEVEEYETEDGIGLRFPKGIEAKTFLAKVEKANQGEEGHQGAYQKPPEEWSIQDDITRQYDCKPSEEELKWRNSLVDYLLDAKEVKWPSPEVLYKFL